MRSGKNMRMRKYALYGMMMLGLAVFPVVAATQAVEIDHDGERAFLLRSGMPISLKGAAGVAYLETLAQAGATAVRTYGDDQIEILDQAEALNLFVIQGLWMEHPRRGFDYADPAQVAQQSDRLIGIVERYKTHPALLIWGLGNEIETEVADPTPVWKAVEMMARKIKERDPDHPLMLTVAEIGDDKARRIKEMCPSIDILGVNTYGDAVLSLGERLRAQGWDKPVIVAELGPYGQWQVGRTAWNAPIEPTSTEKAKKLSDLYRAAEKAIPGLLGIFPFFWGNKQEQTATWYGMLLADGTRLGVVDVLTEVWTGRPVSNRTPVVEKISIEGISDGHDVCLKPGESRKARIIASDPGGDPLRYVWTVSSEAVDLRTGGDIESIPPTHPDSVPREADDTITLTAPTVPGAYRLFVTVKDEMNNGATANIPFLVAE